MEIEKLSELWPEWKVTELIGEGTVAKVYKAVCEDTSEHAAIKVISLPSSEEELELLRRDGMSDIEIISYYSDTVNDIVTEIKLSQALKEGSNVVKVYDYRVVEREGSIGCDIFIRTELLVPMNKYTAVCPMTEADTVKLAGDLCSALEFCETVNVIHRDIKPESIFISEDGEFKLTDFTITKENGQTGSALSSKGGFVYLAPEIVAGGEYDSRADIYSIGLLMYKLCNGGYMPFVDESSSYEDRKQAVERRLDGEALPEPAETTPELAAVILKACAFDPESRYATAGEFKAALENLKDTVGFPIIAVDYQAMVEAYSVPVAAPISPELDPTEKIDIDAPVSEQIPDPILEDDFTVDHTFSYDPPIRKGKNKDKKPEKSNKKTMVIVISCIAAGLLIVGLFLVLLFTDNLPFFSKNDDEKSDPVTASEQIINLLSEDKFDEVNDLYRKYRGDRSKLYDAFMTRLDQIYEEFKAETHSGSYPDVVAELDFIETLGIDEISGKLNTVRVNVEKLYNSRVAYEAGIQKQNKDDYIGALEKFVLVIAEDEKNYADAQTRIEAVKTAIIEEADGYSNYLEAIEYIKSALEILPDDKLFIDKFEELKVEYLAKLCGEADEMIGGENYEGAFNKLNYALEILGESEEITSRIEKIIGIYISDIDALVAEGDYDEAIKTADEAIALFADNEDVNDTLTEKRNEIIENRYCSEIDTLMASKDYSKASELLAAALEELPDSEKLNDYKDTFTERIEKDFSIEINACIDSKKFVEAMELYDQALTLCPESETIGELLESIHEGVDEYYTAQISALLNKYDFEGATDVLNEGLKLNPESEDLNALKGTITTEMEQFYINEADELMDSYDYYGAVAVLEEARKLLPDSQRIIEELNELEKNAPDDLSGVDYSEKSYVMDKKNEEDSFGHVYSKAVSFKATEEAFAEYELDGDYSRFIATVFTTSSVAKNVYIYFDGSDTPTHVISDLTDKTEPISLNIDVSGYSTMRIETDCGFAFVDRYVVFGNPVLYQ